MQTQEKKQIQFYITEEQDEKLNQISKEKGLAKATYCRVVLIEALSQDAL